MGGAGVGGAGNGVGGTPVCSQGLFLGGSDVWAQSYRTTGIKAGEGSGGELSPEASGKAQRGGRPLTSVPSQWEESQQGTGREVLLENRIGGAGAPLPILGLQGLQHSRGAWAPTS